MTREEAREYFEHHMRFYCVTGVCREAEEMAVEEFKKEPCEDTISRLAAIEAIRKDPMGGLNYEGILTRLPSVTPKQRTGHWIECEDEVKVYCSECKEISDYPTNYCPNCGAKMVEPQESGDDK